MDGLDLLDVAVAVAAGVIVGLVLAAVTRMPPREGRPVPEE